MAAITAAGTAARESGLKTAAGNPSMAAITAAGVATKDLTAAGTPSMAVITAAGVAAKGLTASGTPSMAAITAAGVAAFLHDASGTPSMTAITASGSVAQTYKASGTPSMAAITASGAVSKEGLVTAAGNPSMAAITASGSVVQTYKASGTPSMAAITASGTVTLTGLVTAAGNPSMAAITASGSVVQTYKVSGTPTTDAITATGVAVKGLTASGTPSMAAITAAGTANKDLTASGTPSMAAITAAGTATATSGLVTAAGNPSMAAITAAGTAGLLHEASGTPSTAVITAAGVASATVGDAVVVGPAELNLVTFTGLELFGYPPTVIVPTDHFAEPAEGTLTLATSAPITDPVITPAAAALTIEGYSFAAISVPNTTVATPVGTLSLTGKVPTRAHGLLLRGYVPNLVHSKPSPAPALLTLNGKAPLAINTSEPPAEASPGRRQLTLQQFTPALEMGVEGLESSLGLEGWAPLVWNTSPVFFPPHGPLTLTGHALISSVTSEPAADALALSGYAPSIDVSSNAGPAPDTLALTLASQDFTVSSEHARIMLPAAATLTIDTAGLFTGRSLSIPSGDIELDTYAPAAVLGVNRVIVPAEVDLVLSGKVPYTLVGVSPPVPTVNLVLSGQAPTIDHTTNDLGVPGSVALSLTTHAVEAGIDNVVYPAPAALVLSTDNPRYKIKKIKKDGARTRFISLTTDYNVRMLYK